MAPAATQALAATINSGNPILDFTKSKILKDLVLDFCLSAPVALGTIHVVGLPDALAAPLAVAVAIGDTVIRVGFRAVLKWAQSS